MLNDTFFQYKPSTIQAFYSSTDLNATFQALAASMRNAIRAGADGGLANSLPKTQLNGHGSLFLAS